MKVPFFTRGARLVAHVAGQFETIVADLELADAQITRTVARVDRRIEGQQLRKRNLEKAAIQAGVIKKNIQSLLTPRG